MTWNMIFFPLANEMFAVNEVFASRYFRQTNIEIIYSAIWLTWWTNKEVTYILMMNFCSILFGLFMGEITSKRSSDFVAQDDHEYYCKVVFLMNVNHDVRTLDAAFFVPYSDMKSHVCWLQWKLESIYAITKSWCALMVSHMVCSLRKGKLPYSSWFYLEHNLRLDSVFFKTRGS